MPEKCSVLGKKKAKALPQWGSITDEMQTDVYVNHKRHRKR